MEIYQINNLLEVLPQQIRDAQTDFILAKDRVERARLKHKIAFATALVNAKAPNATEKRAKAEIEAQGQALEIIEAETQMAIKEAEVTLLNNNFSAVRKIANLVERGYPSEFSGF